MLHFHFTEIKSFISLSLHKTLFIVTHFTIIFHFGVSETLVRELLSLTESISRVVYRENVSLKAKCYDKKRRDRKRRQRGV
jgi:hypothetical protein